MNTKLLLKMTIAFLLLSFMSVTINSCSKKDDVKIVKIPDDSKDTEEAYIKIDSKSFNVAPSEKEYVIKVESNTTDYQVSSEVEWILITERTPDIKFRVDENSFSKSREGKIIITLNSDKVEEITVKQLGKEGFTLPYLGFGQTEESITNFENKRENKLIKNIDLAGGGSQIHFSLTDEIFSEVAYLITIKGLQQANIFVKSKEFSEDDRKRFEDFLISEGYKKEMEMGYKSTLALKKELKEVFINVEKQTKIEFMDDRDKQYRVSYYPYQTKELSTFEKLPQFLKGESVENVKKYEEANGGALNEKLTDEFTAKIDKTKKDILFFDNSDTDILGRKYFFAKNGSITTLTQTTIYYSDFPKVLYQGLTGDFYPTREFIALMAKNGYSEPFRSTKTGAYIFKNITQSTNVSVNWYKDATVGWTLSFAIYTVNKK